MIQDIYPSIFDNDYDRCDPSDADVVFAFDDEGKMLANVKDANAVFTCHTDVGNCRTIYLFSIDSKRYFLADDLHDTDISGFLPYTIRQLRDKCAGVELFAAFTAYHLWRWYADNRYCGSCGEKLVPAGDERALKCEKCGKIIYPRINPAVIVGVINGDRLLITRYNRGYAHNALVAGFCEIGETLEDTVKREVMEEAGLKVTNIRYYKSQPWGMAQDLLAGFYCDVDGDPTIRMDTGELKYAEFVKREDIELQPNDISLTNEMMRMFKENRTEAFT